MSTSGDKGTYHHTWFTVRDRHTVRERGRERGNRRFHLVAIELKDSFPPPDIRERHINMLVKPRESVRGEGTAT
jgi:hypothetical protein